MGRVRCAFGDLVIDTDRFLLERGGTSLHVQPQVFDVLSHLVRNRERVVPKTELLDSIWGDRFVSESTLTSRIKAARRVVGDDGIRQTVIRTVHGRGYRWVADVEPVADPVAGLAGGSATPASRAPRPRASSSSASASAARPTGCGSPTRRSGRARRWCARRTGSPTSTTSGRARSGGTGWRDSRAGRTFVRYDERGCGLSDHDPEDISLEAFVRDLETVVDELGLERFPLMGLSQGGPVAIAYAVRHPERVSRLVLVGAFVKGRVARATTPDELREAALQGELIRMGWGRDDPSFRLYFSSTFMPDAPPQMWSDFAALMRRTTSAENALRLNNAFVQMDVTDLIDQVTVPTLILHGRDDMRIPFSQGREIAARIRGSRLVPLDTRNHLLLADEPAWEHLLHEVDAFLADDESSRSPREVQILS